MSLRTVREDILRLAADPLVVGHFSDVRPLVGNAGRLDWTLNAALSRAWRANPALLDFGRLTLVATGAKFPFPRTLLVGLGRRERFGREERREAYRIAAASAVSLGAGRLVFEAFPQPASADPFAGSEEDLERALAALPRRPAEVVFAAEGAAAGRRRP